MSFYFDEIPENKKLVVLHTKSRREKKVADYCLSLGVNHFLPLEERIFFYGKQKVVRRIPLFPGYLFCCVDYHQRCQILMTNCVANILEVFNPKRLIEELKKISIAQSTRLSLKPSRIINNGQKVRIIAGPLEGFLGIVQKIKNKRYLIINIDMINAAVAIDVDQSILETT